MGSLISCAYKSNYDKVYPTIRNEHNSLDSDSTNNKSTKKNESYSYKNSKEYRNFEDYS